MGAKQNRDTEEAGSDLRAKDEVPTVLLDCESRTIGSRRKLKSGLIVGGVVED